MQGGPEKLSFNRSTGTFGVITNNPTISLGLLDPYKQQAVNFNNLNHQKTLELHNQYKALEERAVFCLKAKDKVIEEMTRKSLAKEAQLKKALAEAEFWKKSLEQKSAVCSDLAGRLLEIKRRETKTKVVAERKYAEEAESSTGENSDNVLDTARTRGCKRRRL
ncbi:uncharacterized protein LOC111202609 isoform X2 [Brassica napus]|uniref:uncharacterized protein LOC111202609 isoform X2 n=1 Tax=Brassica napus TaxID=3708 RepID=UPI0020791DF4|nr:uncharacterized protein LOC111202609 isoform X2 [Brassica napus]